MSEVAKPRVRVRALGLSTSLPPLRTRQIEGEFRPGPYFLPYTGGWLPADVGQYWNWWQLGYDPVGAQVGAMVETCIQSYAQTIAMCPGDHWLARTDGGRDRVTSSALCRILRRPNAYESISDFLLNTVTDLYGEGNAYAWAVRNDRFEIAELHLMDPRRSSAGIADNGEVFYTLAGNEVIDRRLGDAARSLIAPARDVLHVRLHRSRRGPLRGESPLSAARGDIATAEAIAVHQLRFYAKGGRGSQAYATELPLDKAQTLDARDKINAQLQAQDSLILTHGLKPAALSATAKDSETTEILKYMEQHIALVYRVPMQLLGLGGSPFGSTEALMTSWRASGLGFALNHLEEAFGRLFGLKGQPDEYLEFNADALMRSEFKDRVDAYVRGVQGTIFAPNEARNAFDMPNKPFGDEPRAQQQLVPISAAEAIPAAPAAPSTPPAPPAPQRTLTDADFRRAARAWIAAADQHDRRRHRLAVVD